MPVERAAARRLVSPGLVASAVLVTMSVAGCRTASVRGGLDADPTMKAIVGPAETAEIARLPEGPVRALVAERCLMCHSAGLITQQRKDAAAWGRTVTQMRTWGTPIQDQDHAAIVDYLSEHFGPAKK